MCLLNRLSYSNQVYTNLGLPSPIRIMQTHKQIAFRNQNIAGYIKNPVSLIDRDRYQALVNLNKSIGIEEVSRLANLAFLEQFLSNLHVFNVTICNDHLEPT